MAERRATTIDTTAVDAMNEVIETLVAKGLIKMITFEEYKAKLAAGDFDEDE